jgi:hypothetical protein
MIAFVLPEKTDPVTGDIAELQDMSIIRSFPSPTPFRLRQGQFHDMRFVTGMDIKRPEAWRKIGIENTLRQQQADTAITLRNALYLMGVLSSRGPVWSAVDVDPAVACRRESEGRLPWVSYSLISLPQTHAASGASNDGGHEDG